MNTFELHVYYYAFHFVDTMSFTKSPPIAVELRFATCELSHLSFNAIMGYYKGVSLLETSVSVLGFSWHALVSRVFGGLSESHCAWRPPIFKKMYSNLLEMRGE